MPEVTLKFEPAPGWDRAQVEALSRRGLLDCSPSGEVTFDGMLVGWAVVTPAPADLLTLHARRGECWGSD